MNKRGFTLMELLIYMAIVGIVVVIAGQVYSDSTKMRIRTQSMLVASEIAENVGLLIREDVAQMGAKSYDDGSGYVVNNAVFIDPDNASVPDRSSFVYAPGTNDSLYFRKSRFSNDGVFQAIEAVSWYVKNGALYRSCRTLQAISSTAADESCPVGDDPLEVLISEGVEKFKIVPAKPTVLAANSAQAQLFPLGGGSSFRLVPHVDGSSYFNVTSISDPGESVTISGFKSNYDSDNQSYTTDKKMNQLLAAEANGNVGDWDKLCTKVTLNPDTSYLLSFVLPRTGNDDRSQTFIPGTDFMSVGFRKVPTGAKVAELPDYNFFPSTDGSANSQARTAFYNVTSKVDSVCIAFTFASYSPLVASGSIAISQLTLKKIPDLNYRIVDSYNPEIADKVNVRAFKLSLVIKKNGESGISSHIISVTSNGVGAN